MVDVEPKFTPPAISTSLNPTVPEIVPAPANDTLEVPAVKVPLLVNEPLFAIVIVGVPVVLTVAPALMVMALTDTEAEITNGNGVPEGIVTLVDDVGTPPHQFAASDQSEEAAPIHEPELTIVDVTAKRVVLSQLFVV